MANAAADLATGSGLSNSVNGFLLVVGGERLWVEHALPTTTCYFRKFLFAERFLGLATRRRYVFRL